MNKISINDYQLRQPFPYAFQDGILDESFAKDIQTEILALDDSAWDRYQNPFEEKFTLRDKFNFPPKLKQLFEEMESESFVNQLSALSGHQLLLDPTRNFWGVHKYNQGDKLDIHLDAECHPITKQKKQLTLGIYLSSNWSAEYGCELEIWKGDTKLIERVDSIAPLFNRLIVFTCTDVAWHGNPEPVKGPDDAKRLFITISYLSENNTNQRTKALFIARPSDPVDEEKDKMRLLRADPEKYREVYRI
jgi:2OG-Fe(II) oxygenase superfamily